MRYDFYCRACGNRKEVERKIDERDVPLFCDNPSHTEPAAMRRVISLGTRFTLRGGGWSKDNYSSTKDSYSKPGGEG
jgi:putative FmdB family regulatory protein